MTPTRRKAAAPPPEEILIRDGEAELRLPDAGPLKVPASRLIEGIQRSGVRGLHDEALPDHVRWRVDGAGATVFVVEEPPQIRSILWLAPDSPSPYGPESRYIPFTVVTPYVVIVVPFLRGQLVHHCEVFYRNEPLRHAERDELLFSNLLNVSPNAHGCTAWMCTQYLDGEMPGMGPCPGRRSDLTAQLQAVVQHAWGGGFNRSSEAHEGTSCFTKAVEDRIDPRVTDPVRWQQETRRDPSFILAVPWKSTGMTVRKVLEGHLRRLGALRDVAAPGELASLFISMPKGG